MVRDHIAREATEAGRDPSGFEHALNVWCGFAATREAGREPLATQMQDFYQMPFEPFERYSPYGTPEDVAEFLSPYIEAGCSAFNVIPCAGDDESAIAAVGRCGVAVRHASSAVRCASNEARSTARLHRIPVSTVLKCARAL